MWDDDSIASLNYRHELMYALGLIVMFYSLMQLIITRNFMDGILVIIYGMQFLDFLFGMSLVMAGIRGIIINMQHNVINSVNPSFCLISAIHNHILYLTDCVVVILIIIACADQLISVIWNKNHAMISAHYFRWYTIVFSLFLSILALLPALCNEDILTYSSNITISPFCLFNDMYGTKVYLFHFQLRLLIPLFGVGILILSALFILYYQLRQNWQFKWSTNNKDSSKLYLLILVRCTSLVLCTLIPTLYFCHNNLFCVLNAKIHDNTLIPFREFDTRVIQTLVILTISPTANMLLLTTYRERIAQLFYINYLKRTWQSAEDPPNISNVKNHHNHEKCAEMAGSWLGNTLNENELPYFILNADEQRSVSFFYERNPNL